jgi:acyl-coenzyme A synthetase/AMP-(fatty) acid ligase
VLDALARRREAAPDAVAVRTGTPTGWTVTTWAGLHDDVLRAAAGIAGLEPGDRMVIVVDGSAASLATVLGAAVAGVDAVLVEEQNSYLTDPSSPLRRFGLSTVVGGPGRSYESCRAPVPPDGCDAGGPPGDVLQLTSGSTGEPRVVRQPVANIVHGGRTYAEVFGWSDRDTILAAVPLAHSFGLVGGLAAALASGATLCTTTRFNLRNLVAALSDGATALLGTPLAYRLLVPLLRNRGSFPLLRTVLSSGGPLPRELATSVHRGLGSPVRQVYGSTETGLIAYQPDTGGAWPADAVGVPAPGVEVRIDGDGQLLVRTPTLLRGYLDGTGPA